MPEADLARLGRVAEVQPTEGLRSLMWASQTGDGAGVDLDASEYELEGLWQEVAFTPSSMSP